MRHFDHLVAVLVVLAAMVIAALLLVQPGTIDVSFFWLRWTDLMQAHGLRTGYALAESDYPPAAFLVLHGIGQLSIQWGMSNFLLLKLFLTGCVALSALLFWFWSRNFWLSMGFAFALLLSASAHGYLDIVYLPFLLVSLRSLQARRWWLCALCFSLSTAIKWQSVVLAPFLLLYVGGIAWRSGAFWRECGRIIGQMFLGAGPVVVLFALLVAPAEIWTAFGRAREHPALSYQGLSFYWIVQYFQYQSDGHAGSGMLFWEQGLPMGLLIWPRRIFLALVAVLLVAQFSRIRSFPGFLWFAFTGFLTYCVANNGVHENHLFVAMVLAFLLAAQRVAAGRGVAVFMALVANLNLFIFYGQDGQSPFFKTPFTNGWVNGVTLSLAALNTLLLILCWIRCISWDDRIEAAACSGIPAKQQPE